MDTTTLEANAAMKSIVRRDTGEDWNGYVRRLAEESGVTNPSDDDVRRFDRNRSDLLDSYGYHEQARRRALGIATRNELDHAGQASLDRFAIREALCEHDLLLIRRR